MFIYLLLLITASYTIKASPDEALERLAQQALNPDYYLKQQGSLLSLGSKSFDQAQIILLPEVHDDKDNLLSQFLILAREKNRGRSFIVLDESLKAMEQSSWELFSEKALEIIAAQHKNTDYSVKDFEARLQSLANKLRKQSDLLSYLRDPGIWTLKPFASISTTFWGWDLARGASLYERNLELVKSLKKLLPHYQRIFVMLGARHVPELDYFLAKPMLCHDDFTGYQDFFASISEHKNLAYGLGSSAPLYQFLAQQSYAVVFNQNLYPVLRRLSQDSKAQCIQINKKGLRNK